MKNILALSLLFTVLGSLYAVEHSWKFDKLPSKRAHIKGETFYHANALKSIGKNNSGGLLCNDKYKNRVSLKLDVNEWQVSLDMKLDKLAQTVPRSIFCYEFQDWNRSRFLLTITKEGRLQATFLLRQKNERYKLALYFEVNSEKLKWEPNKWYNLRFGSKKKGLFFIERDGILVGGKENAPSLIDLNNASVTRGYPLITFGSSPINPHKINHALFGVIDNIKISDKFTYKKANFSVQKQSENKNASLSKRIFIGKTPSWSSKFDVLDQTTDVLGATKIADKRFIQNAAKASLHIEGKNLIVDFYCPVPKDMKFVVTPKDSLWKECVEFFICPFEGKEAGFHYAIGANGKMYIAKMLGPDKKDDSFVSKATAIAKVFQHHYKVKLTIPLNEIALSNKKSGSFVRGNFAREGKSCGGLSTWAPVGDSFYNPGRFGYFILGSKKDYLASQYNKLMQQIKDISQVEFIQKQSQIIQDKIATFNDKDNQIDSILTALNNLRLEAISFKQKQRKVLIWDNDIWRNDMELTLTSKPIEKISLSGTLNSHILHGVAISNLSDKPFVGQIKLLSGPLRPYTNARKWFYVDRGSSSNILKQVEWFEGLGLETASGMKIYDALAPLTLNTVVRIPPKSTIPLWVKISTQNVKAATYKGILTLKPAVSGFELTEIPFEIKLKPIDLQKVFLRNYMYTYINHHEEVNDNLSKFLIDHGVNMIYINGVTRYYKGIDRNGNLKKCDFSNLDERIERFLKLGIPKDQLGLLFYLAWNVDGFSLPKSITAKQYENIRIAFLRSLVKHIKDKFYLKTENIVFYPVDEPYGNFNSPNTSCSLTEYFGKIIKTAVPQCKIMVNPRKKNEADFNYALKRFSNLFDIIQLYRQRNDQKDINVVRSKGKTVWYYNIMQKETAPEVYRRYLWENIRDKVDDVSSFWHLESMAGGDGLDPYDSNKGINRTDYGAIYVDFNFGQVLSSRRMEAYLQGLYDFKIVKLCRLYLKKYPNKTLENKLTSIIKKAIIGNYETMEAARNEVLNIIEQLKKNDKK